MPNEWQCYRTVFAARAPIHIGWHSLGLIQRTRYYIPARTMWGTLVAALAPELSSDKGVPGMYTQTAKKLAECLRFTCFFATTSTEGAAEILRPKYTEEKGLCYGSRPAADFESRFVFSQTSAALNPSTFTALDGALHESEYLWDGEESQDSSRSMYFAGYLMFRAPLSERILKSRIANVSVGADRRYGWGMLAVASFTPNGPKLFDGFTLASPNARRDPWIEVNVPEGNPSYVPAHVACSDSEGPFRGGVEVLGGRDHGAKGSGRDLAELALCWAPGTRIEGGKWSFCISEKGIWHTSGPV